MKQRWHKAINVTLLLALVAMLTSGILPQPVYADPDTETLRPNAVGDATNISSQEPSSGAHWDKVDETTADDLSTYVYTASTSYQQDLYSIPDHSTGSGTINSVTVYFQFANAAAISHAIAYTGLDTDGFLKTVDIRTNGQIIDTVIDTLEFDTADGLYPNIINVSGDVYAIAYAGDKDDGFLTTVEIAATGNITDAVIDTLEFDTFLGYYPNIIHVSGDVYAIAYQGKQDDGFLKTVEITTNGQITDTVIDELEFDTGFAANPNIIPVSGDVYTIAYCGDEGDGFLKTVEIATDGQITDTVIDTLESNNPVYSYIDIIHISGDVYAIAYDGYYAYGYLETVEIATDGQITDAVIDTLQFDNSLATAPNIIPISGDVYAIAYQGSGGCGYLKTVDIDTDGDIGTVIDTLVFDTYYCKDTNIVPVSGDVYAIAYEDASGYGYLKTVEIATDGQITDAVIDTLEFDASVGLDPNIIQVYVPATVYAKAAIKTDGTVYTGSEESTASDTFVTKSYQWAKNLNTGSDWTWAEIDALQIGVELKTDNVGDRAACTQVYVVIDYTSLSQTWYLSGTAGSYIMYKGDATKPEDTVTVADNGSEIWRADEAATVNVGFPANTWTGHITFDAASSDTTVRVYVGKWDGSVFTPSAGDEYADVSSSSDFSISASSFTVPQTKWLACKIEDYVDGDSDSVIVSVGSNYSYLTSPSSDPGYPIPELPTIILLGAGLACLGGYIAFMRRRRRGVSP